MSSALASGVPIFVESAVNPLHGGLHLRVVLEEALPERGLVVGLARLGLDGRLHSGTTRPPP